MFFGDACSHDSLPLVTADALKDSSAARAQSLNQMEGPFHGAGGHESRHEPALPYLLRKLSKYSTSFLLPTNSGTRWWTSVGSTSITRPRPVEPKPPACTAVPPRMS